MTHAPRRSLTTRPETAYRATTNDRTTQSYTMVQIQGEKQRVFEECKPTLDRRLGFVRRDEVLVGVKHVGGHDVRRLAQRLAFERRGIRGEGDRHMPLVR